MPDKVGQQIGNYRLVRLLGSGSFAEVYLGQHIIVQHLQAAIKILHTNLPLAHQSGFIQEAETIALLKHPHIIRILEFGIDNRDNAPYLIMDYASNGTLRDRHPKGSIVPPGRVVSYVKQIAEALQYAHDRNLIHRDLKPENLLIGDDGEILVSDFGIATVVHGTTSMETGIYAGTALYSAPEQIQGKPRPASDQYSLGVVVYEWLTGERPFTGTLQEIIFQHLGVLPRPLREKRPDIPPMVEYVIMKALTKDPKERFRRIQAFATAFEQASMSPNHLEPSTQSAPSSQIPTVSAETYPSQQSTVGPLAAPVPGVSVRTGKVLKPRGLILTGVILLLVVLLSVIGGVGVYNTHISQVNASATAQTARNATATAVKAKATSIAQTNAAATASANANSDPYTHRGTLAINDPLSQLSQSHFVNFKQSRDSCEFTNGKYQQQATQQNGNLVCLAHGLDFSNFTFEVRIEILDGNCGGMTFRSPNGMVSDTYDYYVCSDGEYSVVLVSGGAVHTLKIGLSSAILTGLQAVNTLAIVADGNTFNLFVNKQQIATASDPNSTFGHGDIGLLARDVNTPTTVVFSNLRIWTL